MPHISPTLTGMLDGGSDGWEVFLKARAMIAQGIEVTELTIGEHDIRTAPSILAAMQASAAAGNTGYALVTGNDDLRDTIAERITQRSGVPTTRDNVLITPGGQAGLFAAHKAACPHGGTALYIDPYYTTYPGTLRAVGAKAVPVPTRSRDGFQPRAEVLADYAKGASSLLINSPNNPTGAVYSHATLEGIAKICTAEDMWLISDEVYDSQVWEGQHLSPRALPGMAERTFVVGSMSKSHAMTGSRIGWIIAPPEAIEALTNLATTTTYGVAGFIQDAALFALKQGSAFEDSIGAPFARRRALALDILQRQNVIKVIPAQGAMYVMLDIRATGLSGHDFANALLETHKIAAMPGESFGAAAAGHLRVAMTVDDDRFIRALQTICDFAAGFCK